MPLFIPSPVGGHLDCFKILAFVNKAALNIIVHIFGVYLFISLGYIPLSGIAGS